VLYCITVLITSGVFVAVYIVRECKKLRRSRSGHRVLLCYSVIYGKAVCLQTYCCRNVCDSDGDGDDVCFTEDTGTVLRYSRVCVCVCVCMYVRNAVGQMCSRSSMICQVRYGFRFVLCKNPYVS